MAPNLSIFAVPIYWLITMITKAYGVNLIKKANNGRWDRINPRGSKFNEHLRKAVPANTYARYERCDAAHLNGLENMSLFIGAVAVGNIAKLDASILNAFAVSYLALRVIYTLLYINTEDPERGYLRSFAFHANSLLAFVFIGKAGAKLM